MRFWKSSIGRKFAAAGLALLIVTSIGLVGYEQSSTSLRVEHSLDTERIFVRGSNANPEHATVSLRLESPRRLDQVVADVMIVIDRSASFPVASAVQSAKRIIDRLGPDDRVGVVSFATEATLNAPLTNIENSDEVKEQLDQLRDEGKTAMGEGMALATDELEFSGRRNVEWIQILLTDGRSNFGRDPLTEAENAGDTGVVIYSVGVGGSVNRALLEAVSEETGGRFFATYSDSVVDEILRLQTSPNDPIGENIEITATLTENFEFESAVGENAPSVTNNSDGTTTLRWVVEDLFREESWVSRYRISAGETGQFMRVHEFPTEITYEDLRGREVREDLPELRLDVRPTPPAMEAKFSLNIDPPTTFDAVEFTDESTIEGPGEIVEWLWDFGDGTTSTSQNPTHRFSADGTYRVQLSVTSAQDVEAVATQEVIVITPAVSVRRSIDTFIPESRTILGQRMAVTLHIRVNERVSGFGIDEQFPFGWDITCDAGKPDGFSVEFADSGFADVAVEFLGSELQWVFQSDLMAGSEITLNYDVQVPSAPVNTDFVPGTCTLPEDQQPTFTGTTQDPETGRPLKITGTIFSATPMLEANTRQITGETSVNVNKGFDINIVVAHYDTNTDELDLEKYRDAQGHRISAEQLQAARNWWLGGNDVKYTAGPDGTLKKITFEMMNCLTAYYIEQTSVFESLPDSSCN